MKVAINTCYGGFGLSKIATIMLLRKKGYSDLYFYKMKNDGLYWIYRFERISEKDYLNNKDILSVMICTKDFGNLISIEDNEIFDESIILERDLYENRADKDLIEVIETIGIASASGRFADLKIVEIPDDVDYTIDNYDGIESVHEKHRVWR